MNIEELLAKKEDLRQIKDDIGPISLEIIEANSLQDAFGTIGVRDSEALQRLVALRSKETNHSQALLLAEKCVNLMQSKAEKLSKNHPEISSATLLYLDCLKVWAENAGIPFKEAVALQNENFGCQTLVVRSPNGDLVFAHAEEYEEGASVKPGSSDSVVSPPKWTTFKIAGQPIRQAFSSYTQALPGSAFNISDGKFIAVDSLYLKKSDIPGFLANAAVWIAWQLGNTTDTEVLIKNLGPFVDGLAINEIQFNNSPTSKTIEFAQGKIATRILGFKPGDSSLQLNTVTPNTPVSQYAKVFNPFNAEDREESKYFRGLQKVQLKILQVIKNRLSHDSSPLTLDSVKKILGFLGGNGKYDEISHKFTKTWVVGELSINGTFLVEMGGGPLVQRELKPDLRFTGKKTLEEIS